MVVRKLASVLLCILVLNSVTDKAETFLFNPNQACVGLPPCTCAFNNLHCEGKNMTSFPVFSAQNITGTYIYNFHLENNQLTTIPSKSFSNITFSNVTDIYMYFAGNRLGNMAGNAFVGIADLIIYLDIDDNSFTSLPSELQSMTQLQTLHVRNNPLVSLGSDTLKRLGPSLTSIFIDLGYFKTWPADLTYLTSLTYLSVRYLNMTRLDPDVFDGFAHVLQVLYIQYSQLERVPETICKLRKLETLNFSFNDNINNSQPLFVTCDRTIPYVTDVTLESNHLTSMPNVFTNFPSVARLTVRYNNIPSIPVGSFPVHAPLTFLNLKDNALTAIPSAVNTLHDLRYLFLASNKIHSVSDSDLSNLTELRDISLDNNQLDHISPHAFDHNHALVRLDLVNTNITQIPLSLARLHVFHIFIMNNPIECNCEMSVFKLLVNPRVSTIYGNCNNGTLNIEVYLRNFPQNCT